MNSLDIGKAALRLLEKIVADHEGVTDMQLDSAHLRDARELVEEARRKGWILPGSR